MSDTRKKGTLFSITIRPSPDYPLVAFTQLQKWFERNGSESYVSLEKYNHYQCAMISKSEKLPANLKKTLMLFYEKAAQRLFTEDERKKAICVKITADIKYTIGYCQKDGIMQYNTIKSYSLDECKQVHSSGVGKFNKLDNRQTMFSVNQVAEIFLETFFSSYNFERNDIENYLSSYFVNISPFITFSTYQKIKQDSFLEYLKMRIGYQIRLPQELKSKNNNFLFILSQNKDYHAVPGNVSQERQAHLQEKESYTSFEEGLSLQKEDSPLCCYEEEGFWSEEDAYSDAPTPRLLTKTS